MALNVKELHLGKVLALEGDPDGEYRIKIKIPILNTNEQDIWARVLSPYAGTNYGIQFLPEIGDEVIVGFLNADPNKALVLGSTFSSSNPPPMNNTDNNFSKVIVSRNKIKIVFDDERRIIRFESPGGNIIEMNEDTGTILLNDKSNNKVILNIDGITLTSIKDISIEAINDIKISGNNIELAATKSMKGTGSGSAEISSSGNTILKGTMVKIN